MKHKIRALIVITDSKGITETFTEKHISKLELIK